MIRRACSIKPEHQVVLAGFTEAAYPPPGHALDKDAALAFLQSLAFGQVLRDLSGALNVGKLYDDAASTAPVVEVPAWGQVSGDADGGNRRMRCDPSVVYTMLVHAGGMLATATGAIVPAGSGAIGGQFSTQRGALAWDGTGGGAGGTMNDSMRGGDIWFTWRLGVDQPATDINVLVQFSA